MHYIEVSFVHYLYNCVELKMVKFCEVHVISLMDHICFAVTRRYFNFINYFSSPYNLSATV